jgi:hypothetical protein
MERKFIINKPKLSGDRRVVPMPRIKDLQAIRRNQRSGCPDNMLPVSAMAIGQGKKRRD